MLITEGKTNTKETTMNNTKPYTEYEEASIPEILEQARAMTFLADVQHALQMREKVWDLSLRLQVVPNSFGGSDPNWYIIAENRDGEEVTSQNANNKGQHGEHVHPWNGTGEPEMVASSLKVARYWFNKRKEEFGDGHRTR